MPIKLRKDYTGLINSTTIFSNLKNQRKYYIHVYLWNNREALVKNTTQCNEKTQAAFCIKPYLFTISNGVEEYKPYPKLGELHFVKDDWNTEIVAHELQHAIQHRMRILSPFAQQVMDQENHHVYDLSAEEQICYEFGKWFDTLYKWLWKVDAPSSYVKVVTK